MWGDKRRSVIMKKVAAKWGIKTRFPSRTLVKYAMAGGSDYPAPKPYLSWAHIADFGRIDVEKERLAYEALQKYRHELGS